MLLNLCSNHNIIYRVNVYYIQGKHIIYRVNVVLHRTVVVDRDLRFDNLCGSHPQSQGEV